MKLPKLVWIDEDIILKDRYRKEYMYWELYSLILERYSI